MSTPFLESIIKYKSIYYHFLDGLINNTARNTEKITLFLSDYFNISINRTVICNLSPYFR